MNRSRRLSPGLKNRLQATVNQGRRKTVYRMLMKQHSGTVPCYVCGRHVKERNATLEHVMPRSLGGTDDMDNLAISHYQCNQRRGADLSFPCALATAPDPSEVDHD